MALALRPAAPSDADETSMVVMVFGVNDDEEAVLLEGEAILECLPELVAASASDDQVALTIMPEPTNPKVIAVTEVRLEVTVVAVDKAEVTFVACRLR